MQNLIQKYDNIMNNVCESIFKEISKAIIKFPLRKYISYKYDGHYHNFPIKL